MCQANARNAQAQPVVAPTECVNVRWGLPGNLRKHEDANHARSSNCPGKTKQARAEIHACKKAGQHSEFYQVDREQADPEDTARYAV